MAHTKRTPGFQIELRRMIEKLRNNTLAAGERFRLIEILEKNTTDSPCVVKAAEDEPVFTLRGKDPAAPETVEAWVTMARDRNLQHGDCLGDATDCAAEMREFLER